jgi:hypothetical protein
MEPFEKDELQDRELDGLLRQWRAPQAPARLRQAVFPKKSRLWWLKLPLKTPLRLSLRLWTTSIRVPLPVACALLVALALGVSLWPRPVPATRTVIKRERVEVPVIEERVVTRTVYRDRQVESLKAWRPVAELRPRIIRIGQRKEPK